MKLLLAMKGKPGEQWGALDMADVSKFIQQLTEGGSRKSNEVVSYAWSTIHNSCPELLLEGGVLEVLLDKSPHQARELLSHVSPDRLRDLCSRIVAICLSKKKPKVALINFMLVCFNKLVARIGLSATQETFNATKLSPILTDFINDTSTQKKARNSAKQLLSLITKSVDGSRDKKNQNGSKTNNQNESNSKTKTQNESNSKNNKPKSKPQETEKKKAQSTTEIIDTVITTKNTKKRKGNDIAQNTKKPKK